MMWIRFLRATSDILDLPITDILLDKVEPISVNNRSHLGLPKDDLRIVKTLMVVLYSILFIPFIYFCLRRLGEARGVQFLSNSLQERPPPPSTTFLGRKITEGIRYGEHVGEFYF